MMPLSHRVWLLLPACFMLAALAASAVPMSLFGIPLTPNVVWLMAIAMARVMPQAMPEWLAFAAGLMQDVLFGTPLGAQALVAVALVQAVKARPTRVGMPHLRDVWTEAAVLLALAYALLLAIVHWVSPLPPPFWLLVGAYVVNLLWFPLAALAAARFAAWLPKK